MIKMAEKRKYKIYIDTTERFNKKVLLISDDKVIDELSGDLDTVSAISKLLKKNGLSPDNIAEYEPNTGPGSFTGIKIGVTISNILNWSLNKKNVEYKPKYGKGPNIQKK
jgi:tRNA A37 threonylcarbamoyladenosine modification protein TsaB